MISIPLTLMRSSTTPPPTPERHGVVVARKTDSVFSILERKERKTTGGCSSRSRVFLRVTETTTLLLVNYPLIRRRGEAKESVVHRYDNDRATRTSPFALGFGEAKRLYYILVSSCCSRADYWKSQGRKFCDFCKCWIADNKPSIDFHEGGKKHKDNVSKRLKEIHKNSTKQAKQNKKMEDDIRKMESAAMAAYLKDVENNTRDMTADRIIEEKRNRIDTPSGNRGTTIPGMASSVKDKTKQFIHEIDPCDPTLSRTSRQYQHQPRVPPKPENKAQGKSKANKGKGKGKKAQEEDRSTKPVRKLWYEARSPEGYTYYWHIETNETAWEPPGEDYMTFAEQEEEAREQAVQEELLEQLKQEEAIANKEILEEKRANAERERSRQLRKSRSESNRLDETKDTVDRSRDDGQDAREEKPEEEQRPYRRDYSRSNYSSHPYGAWQTVRVVETKPVDLQLPQVPQKTSAPVAAIDKAEPPPPQRTFKEKTITRVDAGGDSDGDHELTAFKKRKIGNKNVRKRLNDD